MVSIDPGQLREKLQLLAVTRISDGAAGSIPGEPVLRYETFAKVTPKSSNKADSEGRLVINNYYEIILRYRKDGMPEVDDIIRYKGKDLHLKAIMDMDETQMLIKVLATVQK